MGAAIPGLQCGFLDDDQIASSRAIMAHKVCKESLARLDQRVVAPAYLRLTSAILVAWIFAATNGPLRLAGGSLVGESVGGFIDPAPVGL
jgi:hypothetical protein